MTNILEWFIFNKVQRRPILNISRERLATVLQSFQPVARDVIGLAFRFLHTLRARKRMNTTVLSISWLTYRCKSLTDSCAVLGSGWLMVVNEKLVPRVERKMALSAAARDTAIEW